MGVNMTTDRQTRDVAIALTTINPYAFLEAAKLAIEASDAKYVPMLVAALRRIEAERYPEQVFLPLTDKQWQSLKLWCEAEGFPLDRLSGNFGRILREPDIGIAQEALSQLPEDLRI
jgi:hypothetical protein